jgi:NAD(P)-dependent dehydrogenase (short-subunit alcohol dehydrogenase family)
MSSKPLSGKVAIITGAGGGLGREYALFLAERGAKVVVNDYGGTDRGKAGTPEKAQAVADEIKSAGGEAIANGGDVSSEADVASLVKQAIDSYGAVHLLVNNAGIISDHRSNQDSLDFANYARVNAISNYGTILLIGAVYPHMKANRYGRIVNTSSDSIFGLGFGGDAAYPASKAAVWAITNDIGRYSPKDGIKINAICPTGLTRMSAQSALVADLSKRFFDLKEVAKVVAALVSEECPVSGELFSVGGPRTARVALATWPGNNSARTPEQLLAEFDQALGVDQEVYVPKNCLDQIRYNIQSGHGVDIGDMSKMAFAAEDGGPQDPSLYGFKSD